MTTRRALIIGGSVGGLFAAHMLGRIGWEVDVFERAGEDLAGRGAGIGTHPALHEVMGRLGLAFDDTLSVATGTYVCWDNADRLLHEVRQQRRMSAWAPLYRALRDNLRGPRYHRGMECIDVRSDAGSATAHFADGSEARGDLLIAADGWRSTVRARLLPELQPAYAGYVTWRALMPESEAVRAARDILERDYLFCVPEGSMALCYAVPARDGDLRVGHRDYNCAWYRPVDEAELAELCTDTSGKCHGTSMPPPLIRPEVVVGFRRSARAELASPMADVFTRGEQPFFQAIYDLASPRLVFGRVALLGDAAFVARPHVGAGVTKAAIDATCLATAIAGHGGDLDAALTRYGSERQRFGDWIVRRGRDLGASIGMRAGTSVRPDREELDRRAAAAVSAYARAHDELSRLAVDGSIPGSA
jgi:2-polyprenyl-6-methoxyphenol hydroxylase-like FAD-dependent oxidoreductase